MTDEIKKFYLKTSIYTNYSFYKKYFCESLPQDLKELTLLINKQYIHRTILFKEYLLNGKIKEEYPWYKYRSHDDILLTVPAIVSELFRLDNRGFHDNRKTADKVIITCRYSAILLASILKARNIPARVRSGFTPLADKTINCDHWLVEYYNEKSKRWIQIDSDIIEVEGNKNYDNTDVKNSLYINAAEAWLNVRSGKDDLNNYLHGSHIKGLDMLAKALFFDFHAIMNDEVSYLFFPVYIDEDKEFFNLSIDELKELDDLAVLMLDIDKNFDELRYLYRNDKRFHAINTPLLSDKDHLEL